MELLALSVGIGLAVSLLFSELFGIAAGGMIVPGYLALSLTRPLAVAVTLAAAFATLAVVRSLSAFAIVYGKRRTALMVLTGYVSVMLARWALAGSGVSAAPAIAGSELDVIGLIIPGLVAIWLDRQGIVETLAALFTASAVVRLVLVLAVGSDLELPAEALGVELGGD